MEFHTLPLGLYYIKLGNQVYLLSGQFWSQGQHLISPLVVLVHDAHICQWATLLAPEDSNSMWLPAEILLFSLEKQAGLEGIVIRVIVIILNTLCFIAAETQMLQTFIAVGVRISRSNKHYIHFIGAVSQNSFFGQSVLADFLQETIIGNINGRHKMMHFVE